MSRRSSTGFAAAALIPLCALATAAPAHADLVPAPPTASAADATFELVPVGTFESGAFDEGASEIVAFHAASERLFVVNALAQSVQVLDVSDPASPDLEFTLDIVSEVGAGVANSVAVRADGLVAVAVEADIKTDAGSVVFFDALGDGTALGSVPVGPLPDMLTFTPDGTRIVVANEGEPDDEYAVDPQGSVSVIDAPAGVVAPTAADVTTIGFTDYDAGVRTLPNGVRVYAGISGSLTPIADSLEPEYVTVTADSSTAYVTLQEANAIAEYDLTVPELVDIMPLGVKDYSESGLDASDDDGVIDIRPWEVFGIYAPDAIASFEAAGSTYLVTANEGDAREWGEEGVDADAFAEEVRVEDVAFCAGSGLDPALQTDEALGRLNISAVEGYDEVDDCYTELHSLGGRSFSIWSADGSRIFDSGSDFEEITAALMPANFNASNDDHDFDSRSDAKGPEPEGLALGEIDGRTYAFVGLERIGGVMAYDVTDPAEASFVTYVNNRDFSEDPESPAAGDLGPEGLAFIAAEDSPTGEPMLAVGNEVSGTTTLYAIVFAEEEPEEPGLPATGVDDALAVWFVALGLMLSAGGAALVLRTRRAV